MNHKKMDKLVDGVDGGGVSVPLRPLVPAVKRASTGGRVRVRGAASAFRQARRPKEGVLASRRLLLADFCRYIGRQVMGLNRLGDDSLAPRLRQTLSMLLEGDAEKQIARKLGISRHTVHVYIKRLYTHFEVSSRSELLAIFIRKSAAEAPAN